MSDNSQQPRHEMRLAKTHPTGVEEWFCPTCGRRFVMRWPPDYQRIILEAGDEYAVHSGGKGGLRLETPQVSEVEEPEFPDGLRAALEDLLEDVDFDNWPNTAD